MATQYRKTKSGKQEKKYNRHRRESEKDREFERKREYIHDGD